MDQYKGFPSVEEYVAYMCFEQTRTEGDLTTYEVVDRLDPAQLASRIIASFDTMEQALTLRDDLRRQYATMIDLTGSVRSVARV